MASDGRNAVPEEQPDDSMALLLGYERLTRNPLVEVERPSGPRVAEARRTVAMVNNERHDVRRGGRLYPRSDPR